MQLLQQYSDLLIFLCWLGVITIGYLYGHHVGYERGFLRGRYSSREHPSRRNS